jgi:serine/threonine protein kinase
MFNRVYRKGENYIVYLKTGEVKTGDVAIPEKKSSPVFISFFSPNLYYTISDRLRERQILKDKFDPEKFTPKEVLGKGDYGCVYSVQVEKKPLAVKYSRLTKRDIAHGCYKSSGEVWFEYRILSELFKKLLRDRVCPNLPLLYGSHVLHSHRLALRSKSCVCPCVATIIELADGSLRDFFDTFPSLMELYSCLFQVLAGVHAYQKHGQIMNYDVKSNNVLFFNIKPGGYWKYTILDKDYYVPNYGRLFIVNDFGISRSFSPTFRLVKNNEPFKLGKRLGMVMQSRFSPIQHTGSIDHLGVTREPFSVSWDDKSKSTGGMARIGKSDTPLHAIQLSSSQKSFLRKQKLCSDPDKLEFYDNPMVVPPFEFFNDTQDVIRTFVGGGRTTQRGDHSVHPCIAKDMVDHLKVFVSDAHSSDDNRHSVEPCMILAGYMIEAIFSPTNYVDKPDDVILESYKS